MPNPRLPLRDAQLQRSRHMNPVSGPVDDTHGRPTTRISCHPRPETRTLESEYRHDARRVEHLQTSMGCVRVRIRSRPDALSSPLFQCAGDELGDSILKNGPIHSEQTYVRCHGRHKVANRRRSSYRYDKSFRAFAARMLGKAKHAPTSPRVPASAKWTSLTRSSGTC